MWIERKQEFTSRNDLDESPLILASFQRYHRVMRYWLITLFFVFGSSVGYSQSKFIDIDFIKKNAVPIKRIVDDIVIVNSSSLLKLGDLIVVIRFYEDNLEIIARGQLVNVQNGELQAPLERAAVVRFPTTQDFVIPVATLSGTPPEDILPSKEEAIIPDGPPPYEPGYMNLSFGLKSGNLSAAGDSEVNSYKKYNYEFQETHFLWYFDFLWRLGLEYSAYTGAIPVKSYDRQERPTTFSEAKFALLYRLLPVWKELRPTLRLVSLNTDFKTTNNDEYIISSKHSGMGLGMNWHYLFSDNLYKQDAKAFGWTVNKAYLTADYFFSTTAVDGLVSRGNGLGQRTDLAIGVTTLMYIRSIPWVKRYSIDILYGQSVSQTKFSGETKSAIDGYYTVPEGSSSTETESFFKVSFGIRFDDLVSFLIKGRN